MRVSYLNAERFHFFIYKIEYISQDRLAYSVSTNSEVSLTTQNKSKSLIHPKSHKRQVNGNSSTSSDSGIPFFFPFLWHYHPTSLCGFQWRCDREDRAGEGTLALKWHMSLLLRAHWPKLDTSNPTARQTKVEAHRDTWRVPSVSASWDNCEDN